MAESTTTTNQLGRRVDKLDGEVHSLSEKVGLLQTDMGGLVSTVGLIQSSQQNQDRKLDKLLEQESGQMAAKDMMPIKYVAWGIGTFLSVVGLGFTAITIASILVMFVVNNVKTEAEKSRNMLLSKIIEESGDRKDDVHRIDSSLLIRRDWMENVSGRLAGLEAFEEQVSANRWTADQQRFYSESIELRLAILEDWRDRNLTETVVAN